MQNNAPTAPKRRIALSDVVKFVVFFGIGLFFIYWFLLKLSTEQREAIWQSFLDANWWWVAAVVAETALSHYVRALRWRLLFKPLGSVPSRSNTFGSVAVAYLSNLAFPRLGEVTRCATLKTSENIPLEKSLGTVVTERLFDVLAFALVLLLGLLVMFGKAKDWLYDALSEKFATLPRLWVVALAAIAIGIGVILTYRHFRTRWLKHRIFKKIDSLITGAWEGLRSIFRLNRRDLLLFIVYSVFLYALYILGGWLIFRAFAETSRLGLRAAFVMYIFGSVGMMISQGGLGAYPVLVWQALDIYGIGETTGLACGWLFWASQQATAIVLGLAYLLYFALKKRKP